MENSEVTLFFVESKYSRLFAWIRSLVTYSILAILFAYLMAYLHMVSFLFGLIIAIELYFAILLTRKTLALNNNGVFLSREKIIHILPNKHKYRHKLLLFSRKEVIDVGIVQTNKWYELVFNLQDRKTYRFPFDCAANDIESIKSEIAAWLKL